MSKNACNILTSHRRAHFELSHEDEIKLAKVAKRQGEDAQRARETLVESQLDLVVLIAKSFRYTRVCLDDLIQIGHIGLLQAVDRFDWTLGIRLSHYANSCVRNEIINHTYGRHYVVKVPTYMCFTINLTEVVAAKLRQRGLAASENDISLEMGISVRKLRECRSYSQQKVALSIPIPPVVSNETSRFMHEDDDIETELQIKDEQTSDPEESVILKDLSKKLSQLMMSLSQREREVLIARFDLDGQGESTLAETAKKYGVSGQRIDQIKSAALQKLRNSDIFA